MGDKFVKKIKSSIIIARGFLSKKEVRSVFLTSFFLKWSFNKLSEVKNEWQSVKNRKD